MGCKKIITITRQYGSGGHDIGKILADKLGISFYDKELISLAAKESGIASDVFEDVDENPAINPHIANIINISLFINRGEVPKTEKLLIT